MPAEGRRDGPLSIVRLGLANLYHGVQPEPAARGHGHVGALAHLAHGVENGRLARQAHQQVVREPPGEQRLKQGLPAMGNPVDHQIGLLTHAVTGAGQVHKGPLVAQFLGQAPFEHDLAVRRHVQVNPQGADHRCRRQGAGDGQFVYSGRGRHRRGQLHVQRRADAHGYGEVPGALLPGAMRAAPLHQACREGPWPHAHQPVEGHVRPQLGVTSQQHARSDVGPAILGKVGQDGQPGQVHVLSNALLAGPVTNDLQRLRLAQGPHQRVQQALFFDPKGQRQMPAFRTQPGHYSARPARDIGKVGQVLSQGMDHPRHLQHWGDG